MKKIKQASIYVLGLVLAVSLLPLSSYAQTAADQTITESRCATAQAKIATRITAISTLQTERATKYATITDRINTFITSATLAKYTNVSKLTDARNSVTRAMSDFTTQATVYKTALQKAESTTCGNNGGEFVTALMSARTELVTLRTDSVAVKSAVTKQAVPALREYATWLKTNSSAAKENQ